ncbi:MAG: TolC family protein [Bacteroidaceae bacterium]|nr:TolC family protein [Bacteroidaceae bacterium]
MKKLLSALLLAFPVAVMAQSASIEQCQQWAQENYPLTQRYDIIRQTEGFTLNNIAKGWLPQIGVSAQGSYQSAVPEYPGVLSNMLSQMGTEMKGISPLQYKAAIDVQQTIYDGGAMDAQRGVAKASSIVQEAGADVQMYALRERVNDLCFAILLLDQRLKLNEELQRTISANHQRLAAMLEGGVAMQADVDAMSAELATARQQHTDIEAQRKAFAKVLSLFIGKDITEITVSPASLNQPAEVSRPELRLFDSQLSLTDAKDRALRASVLPRIGAFAQGYYGYLGMNMFRDMMQRTPTLNGIIGIKASWNLSALYTHKNDRAKLDLERQAIHNDRDVFLFNQQLQSSQEDSNIRRYRQLISEDDNICQLRHNVREAAEAKLEAGIIDVNALILEISRENQANINKAIHETELMQHQYKLQNIKGYETK